MRAPLHPRLAPDPPSASEISTGDFTNRDYESHATYTPGIYSRPFSSHTQSGAGKRGHADSSQGEKRQIAQAKFVCSACEGVPIPASRHLETLRFSPGSFRPRATFYRAVHS
jgi:hypothetical protein